MWTPRRIFLLVIGVVLCSGAYGVYAHYLGWVNGLPPLPERYRLVSTTPVILPPIDPDQNPLTKRIQEAFGFNCDELHYYKIDNRSKGILLLFGDHIIDGDGRVQLTPCSVAIFGKRSANGAQEISTVHCDRAFIQFDKPVKKYTDMDGRKIVSAELRSDPELRSNDPRKGHIHLRNNRRSADPGDAVTMRTVGPIFYKDAPVENAPHVFTDSVIEITDHQNLPRSPDGQPQALLPPTVTATGMKLFLAVAEEQDPKASAPKKGPLPKIDPKKVGTARAEKKPGPGSISGVERVELNESVTMNLWVEPGTGFPGNAPKSKPAAKQPNGKPPEKSLVQIHADGPFRYDVESDVARFDHAPHSDPSIPNYVQVIRHTPEGRDMLSCNHLEIKFSRKKPPPKGPIAKGAPVPVPPKSGGTPENDMDIETVHAWGKTIVLSSDGEDLTAFGNDLVHDAIQKQTILKGEPLIALKEGNQISAREMILVGTDDRMSQQARVKGPGQIDLNQIDPVTKKAAFTRQAVWQDWLVFTRVKEQGRDLDVLTLTGGARFADMPNDQSLSARQLKVWLLPKDQKLDPKAPAKKKGKGTGSADQSKPHRLEATGQVVAHSAELDVQNADYLNIWFREEPPRPVLPAPKGGLPVNPKLPEAAPKAKGEIPAPKANEEPKKAKQPIRINARRIETWVRVIDGKNELERAHCEEQVAVHQDPSEQNENGVDIAGHTVDIEHHPDGSILTVIGNSEKTSGEVHFDKLSLIGDDIVIDQRNNTAVVKKAGSMRMLTSSSLQGEKLAKPTAVTVHWKDAMEFRGSERWVRFEGSVQAEQNSARVLCETMQVLLDREVWLNQAQRPQEKSKKSKDDRSPRVEYVVIDQMPRDEDVARKKQPQPVNYTDELRDGGKLVRFQSIDARELNLDNVKSDVVAPGPGEVRIFQLGSKDPLGDPAPPKKGAKPDPKKPAAEQEMKLTVVKYLGRMKANNKTRTAIFYDTIDVVHLPAKGPDEKYDVNKPGPGMMRLRCETSLEVFTKRTIGVDGKEHNSQNLTAKGNVRVESEDFSGTAESVKYEEEKETVIFEGSRENPAVLYRVVGQGLPPERSAAVKIIYNKRTRGFEMDRGVGVQTN